VAARRGKRKTAATAAFLGESRSFRQKDAACCLNATKPYCGANPNGFKGAERALGIRVFHTRPNTGG
jgi:hypothetical protein